MTTKQTQPKRKAEDEDPLAPFRAHVVAKELEAREAKAVWEKHHFTIEAEKLFEEYSQAMQRMADLRRKQIEQIEELKEQAKKNAELLTENHALSAERA